MKNYNKDYIIISLVAFTFISLMSLVFYLFNHGYINGYMFILSLMPIVLNIFFSLSYYEDLVNYIWRSTEYD